MALRVWMPLNGNLNQQGCSGCYATQSTAPTYVAGKTGKAMSTGGFYLQATEVAKFYNNEAMSFCFWLYPVGSSGGSHIIGQSAMAAGDNRMFTIFQYPTPNDLHLSWQNNDQNNATFFSMSATGFFTANKWTHCAIVYNGSSVKIYRDGSLYNTYSCTKATRTNFSYNVPIPSVSIRYLSDIRIYDHALSEKEVKEISKGLILHYSLDGNGRSADNLFKGSAMTAAERASTGFIDNGSTDWTKPFRYYNGNANIHSFSDNIDTVTLNSTGNLGIAFQRKATDISLDSSSYYTISCEARCTKVNAQLAIGLSYYNTSNSWVWRGGSNTQNFNNTTDWQKFSLTFKPDADTQYIMYCLTVYQATASTSEIFQIRKCKLEKGSVATPWCPNSADVEFGNMGLNSTFIRDSSGFLNNGTAAGTITYESDTPRNSVCSYFANGSTSKITAPIYLNTDVCTMCMWIKSKNGTAGQSGYHIPFVIDGSQYEFSIDSSGKFRNGFYISGSRVVNTTPNPNIMDKNWHMIAATFDGSNIKRYVDGTLVQTQAASGTLSGGSHTVYVGGPYGTDTTYYTKELYESDVRYYCTALSADDIKELYQTSSHICNNGTMMAYSFNEI